mmetsp:Transcript_69658/g.145245  ORF Transcript_69658/g.145245 Transcript_69658/m.145245 type:complete len:144 (-) Transcript_69658:127-558(-)
MLSSLNDQLAARSPPVRFIAISGERVGHEEFCEEYWNGELYFDLGRNIFNLIQEKRLWVKTLESLLTVYHLISGAVRTKAKNIKGNAEGSGLINGGVWVLGAHEQGILFEQVETAWGASVCLGRMPDIEAAVAKIDPQPDEAG